MKLTELITAVKEKNLTKGELEAYREELSSLFALMNLEMAELEKECALFLDASDETTDAAKKRKWNVTAKGQREIELKRYLLATKELISSVRNRLFNIY